jgi:hypothetical protein
MYVHQQEGVVPIVKHKSLSADAQAPYLRVPPTRLAPWLQGHKRKLVLCGHFDDMDWNPSPIFSTS